MSSSDSKGPSSKEGGSMKSSGRSGGSKVEISSGSVLSKKVVSTVVELAVMGLSFDRWMGLGRKNDWD